MVTETYSIKAVSEACRLLAGRGYVEIEEIGKEIENPATKEDVVAIAAEADLRNILDRDDLSSLYARLLSGERSCGAVEIETHPCLGVLRETLKVPVEFTIEGLKAAIDLYRDPKYSESPYVPLDEISGPHADEIKRLAEIRIYGESALPTTPGVLDLADFYHLLSLMYSGKAICTNGSEEACRRMLRDAIYLPEVDPDGVRLTVVTRPNGDGSNIAMVRVTPLNDDETTPPDVFFGGLFQPAGTYLDGIISDAIAKGNEIIIVDSPSVGGSRLRLGVPADYRRTSRAFDVVFKEVDGRIGDLMGHSMGTMIVAYAYLKRRLRGLGGVETYTLIAKVPTAEDRGAGLVPDEKFSDKAFIELLIRGYMATSDDDIWLFMRAHTPEERKRFKRIADRENFYVSDPFTFIWSTGQNSLIPLLKHLGRDSRLRYILMEGDKLQRLRNPEAWRGKRGILVLRGGDHASPAGWSGADGSIIAEATGPDFFRILREKLPHVHDKERPLFDPNEAARYFLGKVGPTLQASSQFNRDSATVFRCGVGAAADGQYGLLWWLRSSFGAQVLASNTHVFVDNDNDTFSLPARAFLGLHVNPLRTGRLDILLQSEGGYEPVSGNPLPVMADLGAGYDIDGTSFYLSGYVRSGYDSATKKRSRNEAGFRLIWPMAGAGLLVAASGVNFGDNGRPTGGTVGLSIAKAFGYW